MGNDSKFKNTMKLQNTSPLAGAKVSQWLSLACAVFAALMFAIAATTKAMAFDNFRDVVAAS